MRSPARLLAAALLPLTLTAAATGGVPTAAASEAGPAGAAGSVDGTAPGEHADGGSTVRSFPGGPSYVVDTGGDEPPAPTSGTRADAQARTGAARTPHPLADTFRLHSLPGAQRTIYLDFDGAEVAGTWWNEEPPGGGPSLPDAFYPGLNERDGDPATFSSAERAIVQEVWQRVAEDFAPFAVDVTTERPESEAVLLRSSTADQVYGVRALVTRSTEAPSVLCGLGCVGVAFIGVFDAVSSGELGPAWAFSSPLDNDPVQLAETISHEVGHTLGLEHDATPSEEYYPGHGVWGPIMGGGYASLTQWSRGEYAGAVNYAYVDGAVRQVPLQDDLDVVRRSGLPARTDDHGGTPETATPLTSRAAGVVSSTGEVDAFAVQQGCDGAFAATVSVASVGPNLDARLRLVDADGRTVATADPASTGPATDPYSPAAGLDAALDLAALPAGAYTLLVDGVGARNPATDGYSAYASLGGYTLGVAPSCSPGAAAPAPTGLTTAYDATTRRATLTWTAPPAAPGDAPVTGWSVRRVGATPTVLGPEARSATFDSLPPGSHELAVAAVTADGLGLEARAVVTVPRVEPTPVRPAAPSRVRLVPGPAGGQLTVLGSWRAAVSNVALTAQRVQVQRLSRTGRVLASASVRVGGPVVRVSLQVPRGRYRLRVVAVNAAGASRPSAWSRTVSSR
ncbi:fibronectin type III domain-containing protein [Nocardioides perillae]|uniref:Fibronectin type-III domain-containing protein n=1 Tax=Nocardioides perillae TaxID=1119534 RepID=A0A7Y9UM16_9ACTN|nr:hypothetical protein [Nocardioides perillae]NYG54926.1 hypothetical protein [Nocardioides perillae]